MKIKGEILSLLVFAYLILMPILPSDLKLKGIPFNGDMILGVVILAYCFKLVINKNARKRFILGVKDSIRDYLSIFLIIIITMMFVSITYAFNKKAALFESIRFTTFIILFFIIKYEVSNEKYHDIILKIFISISAFLGAMSVFDYFRMKGALANSKDAPTFRISALLENSNNLGAFMILAIFPLIVLFINEKRILIKLIYLLSTILVFSGIMFSYSRNALIALIIGAVILVLIYNYKFILMIIVLFIGMLLSPHVLSRLKSINDPAQNISRIKIWKTAFDMIKDHPILGIGNGNYLYLYPKYSRKYANIYYDVGNRLHPHNIIIKSQCELGILGGIGIVGFLISCFIKIKEFINVTENKFYKNFYTGYLASYCAFVFMNLIDNFFSAPKVIVFFWVLLAISQSRLYNIKIGNNLDI